MQDEFYCCCLVEIKQFSARFLDTSTRNQKLFQRIRPHVRHVSFYKALLFPYKIIYSGYLTLLDVSTKGPSSGELWYMKVNKGGHMFCMGAKHVYMKTSIYHLLHLLKFCFEIS